MNFTSTDLAQLQNNSDATAVQKADLDLLSKINQLGAVSVSVVSPLSSQIKSNTTYSLPNTVGITTVYIPVQSLSALVGGGFTLTLSCGTGTSVIVPIAAAGTTVSSGNLLFDVYCDGSGNLSSKDWSIAGYNSYGNFKQGSDGTMIQWGNLGTQSAVIGFSQFTATYPIPFVGSLPSMSAGGQPLSAWSTVIFTAWFPNLSLGYVVVQTTSAQTIANVNWSAIGRWK